MLRLKIKYLILLNQLLKAILDTKINEVKTKIPCISGLAATSTLTAVENKMPNVNNLDKKTDYDKKFNEI